jgi:hypothetical protein
LEWTLFMAYEEPYERADGVTLPSESLCQSLRGNIPLTIDAAAADLARSGPTTWPT